MDISSILKTTTEAAPRVSALSRVRKGPIRAPLRVLGYGSEGVGKSTFASGAPRPIWLGGEGGTMALDVERLPEPRTWDEAMSALADVRHEKHDYETLVVDPLNWLEPLNWAKVTKGVGSIEDLGYGKGYVAAVQNWRAMLAEVSAIWSERHMHVVVLAHATLREHPNPSGATWPQWVPAIDKRAVGTWTQWVDHVLFMQVETIALKADDRRTLGQTTGLRVCHAAPSGGWLAKSRGLPDSFPLSWAAMVEALDGAAARTAALRAELAALLEGMPAEYAAKARAAATQPAANLDEIVNKVRAKKEQIK